jgi:replicative DNA helicase
MKTYNEHLPVDSIVTYWEQKLETIIISAILQNNEAHKWMPVDEDFFSGLIEKDMINIILSYLRKWEKIDAILLRDILMSKETYTITEIVYNMSEISDCYVSLGLLPSYYNRLCQLAIERHTERIKKESIELGWNADETTEKLKFIQKFYAVNNFTSEDMVDAFMADLDKRQTDWFLLKTWYERLDDIVWFERGWLCTIAARSSMGKSTYAVNIAHKLVKQGRKVVVFSMEMNKLEYMHRLASAELWVNTGVFKGGSMPPTMLAEFVDSYKAWGDNLTIIDGKLSPDFIEKYINTHPDIDCVVVDYLQILDFHEQKWETKASAIGRITSRFKQIAQENNILFIQLSQVSRGDWNDKLSCPRLETLKDSGSIEQDSDIVLILHRENREVKEGIINVAKNRHGKTWEIQCVFRPDLMSFIET